MSHHKRSKSTSSIESVLEGSAAGPGPGPSIAIPRRGSMSQSFHFASSPITFSSNHNASNNTGNPFLTSPTAATGSNSISGTTPPTNLSALSSSIPMSISGRRFSSSFTNPLTMGSPPANGFSTGQSQDDRSRRTSLFGSAGTSPPFSRLPVAPNEMSGHPIGSNHEFGGGGGSGGGGGIGGLFRKFSASNRGTVASTAHPLSMDKNEPGPHTHFAHPENNYARSVHPLHNAHLDVKKDTDKDSRSNSPMRTMILNGQMLD
ncbi:hypothetical protein EMPS_05587 [Entomortierella parvispora]|uniref:Uncharacterized protein n=1 Tax=Entomortierella parvispora TaxID=205924 RepID=A0A9P3HAM2_9FUNG|nr:hypothetical protein EMPS_05587 [Entomortierella parvispora]